MKRKTKEKSKIIKLTKKNTIFFNTLILFNSSMEITTEVGASGPVTVLRPPFVREPLSLPPKSDSSIEEVCPICRYITLKEHKSWSVYFS
jgi:hypothetical protein